MRRYSNFNLRGTGWGYVLAIASLIAIAIATLRPFDFVIPQNTSLQTIVGQFERTSNIRDYISNIILFMPWGYSLAWILPRKKLTNAVLLILGIISSLAFSLTVEVTQYFLPERVSNFADVATNTIGGGVGVYLYFWQNYIINFLAAVISNNRHRLTPKSVGLVFVGYFVFSYLVIFGLLANINIANWDNDFPLIIGNEATGDRPWQGKIAQLDISDRSLSPAAINSVFEQPEDFWLKSGNSIASYLFSEKLTNDRDASVVNAIDREPVLVWQGNAGNQFSYSQVAPNEPQNITLNSDRWLMTPSSASVITEKLKKTNQFTISAIVATENVEQPDFSRVVSLSNSPFYRNITIAQKQQDLILRLRTPVTDQNGSNPQLLIPNVFSDPQFHHLIFTFNAEGIKCYIDNLQNNYIFKFEPEIIFWSVFPLKIPGWKVNLKNTNKLRYRISFYLVLFVPLGLLGGLLLSLFNRRKTTQLLLLSAVGLLPALLLEQLYMSLASQPIRMFNLLLSIAILLSATLLSTTVLFKNSAYKIQ